MGEGMTSSSMRDALLAEHRAIRAQMDAVRAEASRSGDGELSSAARAALTGLGEVVASHIAHETLLLRHVRAGADSLGRARLDAMLREHAVERAALDSAPHAAAQGDGALTVAHTLAALDTLSHHMAQEERDFLAEEVLHEAFHPRQRLTR